MHYARPLPPPPFHTCILFKMYHLVKPVKAPSCRYRSPPCEHLARVRLRRGRPSSPTPDEALSEAPPPKRVAQYGPAGNEEGSPQWHPKYLILAVCWRRGGGHAAQGGHFSLDGVQALDDGLQVFLNAALEIRQRSSQRRRGSGLSRRPCPSSGLTLSVLLLPPSPWPGRRNI